MIITNSDCVMITQMLQLIISQAPAWQPLPFDNSHHYPGLLVQHFQSCVPAVRLVQHGRCQTGSTWPQVVRPALSITSSTRCNLQLW